MRERILVIEDDEGIAGLLTILLERAGLHVMIAANGRAGLREIFQWKPDVVVLDVGLPDLDGWQVLERIRDISDVPVLMLTARAESHDVVRGLRAGADDYLTKPFHNSELMARLEVLLRRRRQRVEATTEILLDGSLEIDLTSRTVVLDEREVSMTPIEFRLLVALIQHRGQVLSPEQLLDIAWKDTSGIGPDRVKFSVHRLRRKLGWDAEDSPLEAVRGFGYRYRRSINI